MRSGLFNLICFDPCLRHVVGGVEVETSVPAWQTIEDNYPMLQNGGRYHPPDCEARHRVALIIPFRDRDIHLKIFLNNIHSFLMRQQLDYGIFVIDLVSKMFEFLNTD